MSVPYLGIVAGYVLVYRDIIGQAEIVVAAAGGAAIGKIIIYLIGAVTRKGLSQKSKENLEFLNKLAKRSMFLLVFLLAATPVPDDILYIPLGIMRYPLLPYFIAIFFGKLIITASVFLYASWVFSYALSNVYTIPIWVAITIILAYIIVKIDWYKVFKEISTYGTKGAIKRFCSYLRAKIR